MQFFDVEDRPEWIIYSALVKSLKSHSAARLLIKLASVTKEKPSEGFLCTNEELAKACGCVFKTICRNKKKLVDLGVLVVNLKSMGHGRYPVSQYFVNVNAVNNLIPFPYTIQDL
jgi:hypothetical protein